MLMNSIDVVVPRAIDRVLTRTLTVLRGTPVFESPPPRRFRYQSLGRLRARYVEFRENDDFANATACFGLLADYRYRELAKLPDFDATRKSIVSMFQPKSGGTYLHRRILQLGYQDFWWFFPHRLCHATCYPSDEALRLYLAGGCSCHSHARPDPNIVAALDRAQVDKIWVHLRNPAECVVPSFHHFRGEGHGGGELGSGGGKKLSLPRGVRALRPMQI